MSGIQISTQFISLRKTPYMESSLIVSGISPDCGRIDFLVKGARKISKSTSPEIDIFRVFNVQFTDRGKSLMSPLVMEYLKDFDKLALKTNEFCKMIELIPFILNNTHYAVPCRRLYNAFLKHLERVINGERSYDWLIKLTYIQENGLLPHNLTMSGSAEDEESAQKLIKALIDYANGFDEFPKISEKYLNSFSSWINIICSDHYMSK